MNDNKRKPIGVFDSGIGGITTLDKIYEVLPNEDYIYIGDTLNCPYGVRSAKEIRDLVTSVAKALLKKDVKAIVIACNTATANSTHLKDLTDVPVIGVIEPTALYAYKESKNKNILVLATNATIDSHKYQEYLEGKDDFGNKYYVKCSEFVPICEAGLMGTSKASEVVKEKIGHLKDKNIDVVISGCTHFGLLEKEIKENIPNSKLIECGYPTGLKLKEVLEENNLLNNKKTSGRIDIYTTGDIDYFENQIKWFKKPHEKIKKVELE